MSLSEWRCEGSILRCCSVWIFLVLVVSSNYVNGDTSEIYNYESEDAAQISKPAIHLLDKRETNTTDVPPKISKTTGPPKKATSKAVEPTKPSIIKSSPLPDDKVLHGDTLTEKFPSEENYTEPPNVTKKMDTHIYYNSTFITDPDEAMAFWVDFDNLPKNHSIVHTMLSSSHRRADTIPLKFEFPFYGHKLRNITIATGGFLYTGEHMHNWLAATQYIAPLMANFDTSLKNSSHILYYDNGTAFTVYWKSTPLQDRPNDGDFSFQVTLQDNGNIVFVYKEIPIPVNEINDQMHPVKIGLSDAYVVDKLIYYFQKKTIYEYHRVDLKSREVANHTAIFFTALPTCISFTTCESCTSAQISFKCKWCEKAKRCSTGTDRYRQDWFIQQCDQVEDNVNCSAIFLSTSTASPNASSSSLPPAVIVPPINASTAPSSTTTTSSSTKIPSATQETLPSAAAKSGHDLSPAVRVQPNPSITDKGVHISKVEKEAKSSKSAGTVVAVLTMVALIGGVGLWVVYAYKNPQSSSGQLLIKYRPTQWRWKHGEARYTAASSIHI